MSNDTQFNLLAPWLAPGEALRGATVRTQTLQHYFTDLQKRYVQTVQAQAAVMASSGAKITHAWLAFGTCKQPQDVVEAETALATTLLEIGEGCTKPWIEFARDAQAAWSDAVGKHPADAASA